MQIELFANFERMIFTELAEKAALLSVPDPAYFKATLAILQQDAKNIERRLIAVNTNREMARWTTNSAYQKEVESLLNMLYKVMVNEFDIHFDTEVSSPDSWHALMEEIAKLLTGLLDRILVRYWNRCDHGGLLPEYTVKFFELSRTEMLKKVLTSVPEGTHCYEVIKLLLLPMEDWEDDVSSFHFHYFDKLIRGVNKILKGKEGDKEKAEEIKALLWDMNFNHSGYALVIAREIRRKEKGQQNEIKMKKHHREDILYFKLASLKHQVEDLLNNELIANP
jgi:hypothetical protein